MPVPVLAGDQRRSLGVSSPQFLNPPPVNIAHHSTPALKGCLISCSCSLRTRAFSPAPAARVQRELGREARIVPDLVFDGIARYAGE